MKERGVTAPLFFNSWTSFIQHLEDDFVQLTMTRMIEVQADAGAARLSTTPRSAQQSSLAQQQASGRGHSWSMPTIRLWLPPGEDPGAILRVCQDRQSDALGSAAAEP